MTSNTAQQEEEERVRQSRPTMSSTCGDCSCADKSQCVKKGKEEVVAVGYEKSYAAEIGEFDAAAEHNGKCKCGSTCTCIDCSCGN